MRNRWFWLLSGSALCLPVLYVSLVLRRPAWDESLYHLPELARYGPGIPGIASLREAGSAVGPLFYVLFGNLAAPFGGGLLALRLVVFACAVGCLLVFGRISEGAGSGVQGFEGSGGGEGRHTPSPPLLLLLVTFPYFFTCSGLFMSELPALFAGLAGFLLYLRWRARPRVLALAGCLACTGAAVLLRQYFAFLPAGLAAHELFFPAGPRRRGLWFALPALLPLLYFPLWGGLVPPSLQARHAPGLSFSGVASFLAWTGVYGLPWLWSRARRTAPGAWLLLGLAAVPLSVAGGGPGAGIVSAVLELFPAPARPVLAAVAATLGGATLVSLARGLPGAGPAQRAATVALFALGLVFAAGGPLAYERYFLPALPLLLVAFAPDVRPLPALAWSLGVQLPLAVVQLLRLAGK